MAKAPNFIPYAKKKAPQAPDGAAAPARGKRNLFIAVGAAFVLLAGGGGGAFYVMRGHAQPAHAASESAPAPAHAAPAHAAAAKPGEGGLVSLEPFTVNLSDPGVSRYLRVSMRLVVGSPAEAEHVQKTDVLLLRVRSSILELLAQQTADALVTPAGKTALKTAIAERVNTILEETKVSDVLFADFVVQF